MKFRAKPRNFNNIDRTLSAKSLILKVKTKNSEFLLEFKYNW
jgi:hypothetical protein